MDTPAFSGGGDVVDFLHQTVLSGKGLASLLATILVIILATEAYRSNFPKIEGIPEAPGALPFVGLLHRLGGRSGENDATVFSQWAAELNTNVFQCVLGNQRTVVVSDWATMKHLWVSQANKIMDRPHQPGFVDKLGIDLTGMCMTDQVRKCRNAGMRALAKPNWPKYYHLLEPSSGQFVRALYEQSSQTQKPMDMYVYLRQIVFDLALSLTYGARFGEVDDAFMLSFLQSIHAISTVRSSTARYRHFVPLLRLLPEPTSATMAAERVRRRHRDVLFQRYHDRRAAGETVDCIVAALQADRLTVDEVHGTCLSLLQAAPDTVASGVYMAVAWLAASPAGRAAQAAAHQAILDAYGGDRRRAWAMAFREERVPLIASLNKEALRFFTLTPYATPRRTNADVVLPSGVVLPAGITLIMNAQAIDHDTAHFGDDAWTFRPDRYLEQARGGGGGGRDGGSEGLPHVAFGAGARLCPAVHISNRIICALLTRLLLAFEMDVTDEPGKQPVMDAIRFSNVAGLVAHPRLYECHFKVRDVAWLESVLAQEEADAVA